jgi:hypothetical protein
VQRLGDEAEILAAEGAPVAAVEEDMDRRVEPRRREDIERLRRALTEGDVERARDLAPDTRALALPAREVRVDLRLAEREARAVLGVDLRLGGEIPVEGAAQGTRPTCPLAGPLD